MDLTCRNNFRDKEPTMSRIVKIVAASAIVLALVGITSPAQAVGKVTPMGGRTGCCVTAF